MLLMQIFYEKYSNFKEISEQDYLLIKDIKEKIYKIPFASKVKLEDYVCYNDDYEAMKKLCSFLDDEGEMVIDIKFYFCEEISPEWKLIQK